MEKVFNSKVGLEILIPLCLIFGGVIVMMIVNQHWGGLVPMGLVILFSGHFYFTTYYKVRSDKQLEIRCGFLFHKTFAIDRIRKIAPTYNPLSSPALSLDRLEISYDASNTILVSPKDREGFIAALVNNNPAIVVM